MAAGSVIGVFLGGWLARFVPGAFLQGFLSSLLIVSAGRALDKER